MKTLPEILALAERLGMSHRLKRYILPTELQSFVAAIEQQAYERGLEGAAKHCDKRYAFELAREIRAMKEPK